jgi:endoglucanase
MHGRGLFLVAAMAVTGMTWSRAAIDYRGINLSAADFGYYSATDGSQNQFPGIYGTDYVYPDDSYFDYFHDLGMNTFRIPFRWERIQPTLGGALDPDELARLRHVVDYAASLGANVILDVHNYAHYSTSSGIYQLGTPELPDADLADLWSRLGTTFAGDSNVIFDLMNEPSDVTLTTEEVVSFTNSALSAIRTAGATNLVLVEGNGYSGGHSWEQNWYGTPNSVAMLNVVDPGNNMAFEVHQYVDNNPGDNADYSGTTENVESATIAADKLAGFTDWLRTNNLRGFLGELGTPASDLGIQAMFNGINFVENNADVWEGWTLWSGGPWWDASDGSARYFLSLNPELDSNGNIIGNAPQIDALAPFLNPVPEPETWLLCAMAGALFLLRRRRPTAARSARRKSAGN